MTSGSPPGARRSVGRLSVPSGPVQFRAMREPRPGRGLPPEVREQLLDIYRTARTIAVVGASGDPSKPANEIPAYLQSQGYRIVPVNPRGGVLFGERAYRSLEEVAAAGLDIDVVDVFRPADEAPAIARQAVALGARVLWLQYGIESEEAATIAAEGGLRVVMNRCMGVMHQVVGLGPGPHSHDWRRPAP